MNEQAKKYWDEFWKGKEAPVKVVAEQFGWEGTPLADELADLIVKGIKTGTCSGHMFYGENDPLPEVGQYTVILNSKDMPVAIVRTTVVEIMPLNEVGEEFATSEGEGDLSYRHWWNGHVKFFAQECEEAGMLFSEDMLVVCETFELVDVKGSY